MLKLRIYIKNFKTLFVIRQGDKLFKRLLKLIVCLDFLIEDNYQHTYHQDCIREWVEHGEGEIEKCPVCKRQLQIFVPQEVAILYEKLDRIGLGFEKKELYSKNFTHS
uniref:Zinc finger C3HC4 RING-type domain-containing protein n=1 Tax=Meloidogyne enterolobii TaxID=390850 RepID=A0A6V7X6G6_MELEN|nr:unnamed protein product [Meloidogyne enterolobii]